MKRHSVFRGNGVQFWAHLKPLINHAVQRHWHWLQIKLKRQLDEILFSLGKQILSLHSSTYWIHKPQLTQCGFTQSWKILTFFQGNWIPTEKWKVKFQSCSLRFQKTFRWQMKNYSKLIWSETITICYSHGVEPSTCTAAIGKIVNAERPSFIL